MDSVIYLRVSTQGQAIDGYGLDVQERMCREHVARAGYDVVDVLKDEGLSGALPSAERPALMDGLAMLREDLADVLVVARLDRLARALTTQEAILAEVWKYGAHVDAADMGRIAKDDPDDPMRTAMRQMAGVFAELDRAVTVKRLRDGRKPKAARGGHGSGSYPFGFSTAGPVPDEQRILAEVRSLRRAGHDWQACADDLNRRGLSPRKAQAWTKANLRKVMERPR